MNQEKKKKTYSLDEDVIQKIEELAWHSRINKSQLIEMLVREKFEQLSKQNQENTEQEKLAI